MRESTPSKTNNRPLNFEEDPKQTKITVLILNGFTGLGWGQTAATKVPNLATLPTIDIKCLTLLPPLLKATRVDFAATALERLTNRLIQSSDLLSISPQLLDTFTFW